MKNALYWILVCSLLFGCTSPASTPEPTLAPTSTATAPPTETPTAIPTNTAAPTEELTVLDPNKMEVLVVAKGFTISIPFPLLYEVDNSIVIVGDEGNTLTFSFVHAPTDPGTTLDEVIDAYLSSLEKRGWEFTKSEPTEIQIDGVTGIVIDLDVKAQNLTFEGQAVAVLPEEEVAFFGLGLGQTSAAPDAWTNSGQEFFTHLVESVAFVESTGECPISTDETYGYSETNPIKVGGEFINGVSRERAYLNHLRGLNGEILSYEREGSVDGGSVILDKYHITGPGVDKVLYVDLYSYEELFAPVGFTCEGPFPLSAP